MRLRLLVPRGGRGSPLRGLTRRRLRAALVAAVVVAVAGLGALLAARSGGGDVRSSAVPAPRAFAVGLVEVHPALIAPFPGSTPTFDAWRVRGRAALRPQIVRVNATWDEAQPDPAQPPDWGRPNDGCVRGSGPCVPFAGRRALLRAAARAGMPVLLSLWATPAWAAAEPSGCERPGTGPVSRPPRDLAAYATVARTFVDAAREEGARVVGFSPWNEPNHPYFLSPQRATCDAEAPSLAAQTYAGLVRAARDALGPRMRLVLGETAGFARPRPRGTGAAEFARALPRDVVCSTDLWAQHAYVAARGSLAADAGRGGGDGSPAILADVRAALASHRCPRAHRLWITETGVFADTAARGCRALRRALDVWSRDPSVDAVFQYELRGDPSFDTGLAPPDLAPTPRPALEAWQAFTERRPARC